MDEQEKIFSYSLPGFTCALSSDWRAWVKSLLSNSLNLSVKFMAAFFMYALANLVGAPEWAMIAMVALGVSGIKVKLNLAGKKSLEIEAGHGG